MPDQKPASGQRRQDVTTLVVRKIIQASPERLFAAWIEPEQLKQWWGPPSVNCVDAQVDARVGGRYRIANQLPDGNGLWITGEFQAIEPPRKLVYTWSIEPASGPVELVTVLFEPNASGGTEVIVTHERIPDKTARDTHMMGWQGCLDGLAEYLR